MDKLINIILEIAVLAVTGMLLLVGQQVKTWVKELIEKVKNEKLQELVINFVESVEQTLKEDDPTGARRFAEVERLLEEAGYVIDDLIRSMIESAVYRVNLNNKKK